MSVSTEPFNLTRTDHLGRTDFLATARAYAERMDEWPFAPRFDPSTRWYKRLGGGSDLDVWLLTWLPGQGTDLHDHGGSAGGLVVVTGELTEYTVAHDATVSVAQYAAEQANGKAAEKATDKAGPSRLIGADLAAGDGRRFGPRHVHQMINNGDRPAISVHVYGPRLTSMTRYQLDHGRLLMVAVDRAGEAW